MEAKTGIQFLSLLLSNPKCPIDTEDLEKTIEIASRRAPPGAFREAGIWYRVRHGLNYQSGLLGFQKGVRWLAVLRRDEGEKAFHHRLRGADEKMIKCWLSVNIHWRLAFLPPSSFGKDLAVEDIKK